MRPFLLLLFFAAAVFSKNFYSYEDGLLESKKIGKPLMVYLYREHCPYCNYMDTYVLSDADVEAAINQNFVFSTLDLDSAAGEIFSEKYKVSVSPSFLFFSPDGKLLKSFSGSREKESFIKELKLSAKKQNLSLKDLSFL